MIYLIIILVLGLLLLLYMYKTAHTDNVDNKTIIDDRFPASFGQVNLFFISDTHKRLIKKQTLAQLSDKVDIVIIGGDLTEKGVPIENVKENINRLKELNAPIYFIWGNNDYETDFHELDVTLLENDVKVLANTAANFETEAGDSFSLLGLDCLHNRTVNFHYADHDAYGSYRILITHDPKGYHNLDSNQKRNIHMVLSGHTHGGQIRLFGWSLYPKGGWKIKDQTHVLISEGYGTTFVPLRLGTSAQCHLIKLSSSNL